jgi:Probable cobalt transporter subunit (CbtB)
LHGGHYAREAFELKDDREAVAAGGGAQLRVLDFEFLSRSAPPSKQGTTLPSMIGLVCREFGHLIDNVKAPSILNSASSRGTEAGEIPARSRHCNRLALKAPGRESDPPRDKAHLERDAKSQEYWIMNSSTLAPTAEPVAIPLREALPWAIFGGLLLMLAIYFVGAEQGATSLIKGMYVHEFVHDGRHLLGFPCH